MIGDNTKFKKLFNICLQEIIGSCLKEKGYKYCMRFFDGLFWFEKSIENVNFHIGFQVKSLYMNSFGFYFYNTGKVEEEFPYFIKDNWEVHSEEELKEALLKIKREIEKNLLPWFATVKKIEVDYKRILLNCVLDRLKNMSFIFKEELYNRKIIYSYSRSLKETRLEVLFPFLRETNKGYDVVRFEANEICNSIGSRLLFYPETIRTKDKFVSTLIKNTRSLQFENETEYITIINRLIEGIEAHADKWFNENRPSKKPNVENWGLFPDIEELPKKKKKKYEELFKSLPPLK